MLLPAEVLVVHDMPDDTTVPYAREIAARDPRVRTVLNTYGPGPANAIRFGIDAARAPVAVVTMADGCDDPRQIDDLARLVDRGVVVAAASRYMPGGQQVGGPRVKRMASRWAGRSLRLLARGEPYKLAGLIPTGSAPATRRTASRPTTPTSYARSASSRAPASRSASS